jgi:hypothetical protein
MVIPVFDTAEPPDLGGYAQKKKRILGLASARIE